MCSFWQQGKSFGVESWDPVIAATSAIRKPLVFSPAKAERGRKELIFTERWTSLKKRCYSCNEFEMRCPESS